MSSSIRHQDRSSERPTSRLGERPDVVALLAWVRVVSPTIPHRSRMTSRSDGKRPAPMSKRNTTSGPDSGVALQVNGLTRTTLSRWRHGFKSAWDYQGKRFVGVLVSTLVKVQTRRDGPPSLLSVLDLRRAVYVATSSPGQMRGSGTEPSGDG